MFAVLVSHCRLNGRVQKIVMIALAMLDLAVHQVVFESAVLLDNAREVLRRCPPCLHGHRPGKLGNDDGVVKDFVSAWRVTLTTYTAIDLVA